MQVALVVGLVLASGSARAEASPWNGVALGAEALVAGDTPQKLDGALQRAGYSSLPTTRLQLGPAFSVWYQRWDVGGEFVYGLARNSRGPGGGRFSLQQWMIDFHGGYAVVETQNLAVSPAVIVGAQVANAEMDPYVPLFANPPGLATPVVDVSQQSVIVGLSLGFDYKLPLSRRHPRSWRLIFGTHVGFLRGFPQGWYGYDVKLDGPGVSGSGPFARFWVGITLPS